MDCTRVVDRPKALSATWAMETASLALRRAWPVPRAFVVRLSAMTMPAASSEPLLVRCSEAIFSREGARFFGLRSSWLTVSALLLPLIVMAMADLLVYRILCGYAGGSQGGGRKLS